MYEEIERVIKLLSAKINSDVSATDALKFTQAALNLAHTMETFAVVKRG